MMIMRVSKLIRFYNYEIEHHLDTVLDTIAENCDLPSPKVGGEPVLKAVKELGMRATNENLA